MLGDDVRVLWLRPGERVRGPWLTLVMPVPPVLCVLPLTEMLPSAFTVPVPDPLPTTDPSGPKVTVVTLNVPGVG